MTQAGVGTNRYSYAGGDPVNGIDPSGHETYTDAAKNSGLIDIFKAWFDATRTSLSTDRTTAADVHARVAAGQATTGAARMLWTQEEREMFGRIARSVGGRENVTAAITESQVERIDTLLAGIGAYGENGSIVVDYAAEGPDVGKTKARAVADPGSNRFTFFGDGINTEGKEQRTVIHESAHAILGFSDGLPGYSGPETTGVRPWNRGMVGYSWEGIALNRTLANPNPTLNDAFVCTLTDGGCWEP